MSVITHICQRSKRRAPPLTITQRLREVLYWAARGKTNFEIGLILNISPRTIKNHMRKACIVYGRDNRVAAITTAIVRGDISLQELQKDFGKKEETEIAQAA